MVLGKPYGYLQLFSHRGIPEEKTWQRPNPKLASKHRRQQEGDNSANFKEEFRRLFPGDSSLKSLSLPSKALGRLTPSTS